MNTHDIYSAASLTAYIQQIGFLPLLDSGIRGYSAEEVVSDDCRYVVFPDGGWDWPLWKWKGPIVSEGSCVYGKFFAGKAGFVSREWWPDLLRVQRSEDAQQVRRLRHPLTDGLPHCHRRLRLSDRQAWT